MRRILLLPAALAFAPALASPASADVLVNAPYPFVKDCGDDIEVGVWYQAYNGGPRWATIAIKSINGKTLAFKRVTARTTWRLWHYKPPCGHRYQVVYNTPGGRSSFRVRVRA